MSEPSLPTSTIVAATSSDQPSPTISPFILAFNIVVAVFSWFFSFNWSGLFSRLFTVIRLPFRLILLPLSFVVNILLTVFAPAIYLFSYTVSGVRSVWAFFASLEVWPNPTQSQDRITKLIIIATLHLCKAITHLDDFFSNIVLVWRRSWCWHLSWHHLGHLLISHYILPWNAE